MYKLTAVRIVYWVCGNGCTIGVTQKKERYSTNLKKLDKDAVEMGLDGWLCSTEFLI